jgi:hypothetical protein
VLNLTGLPALDLAIGLAFIYFLLSTVAATVQEFIAAIFGLRARTLEQGLRSMLGPSYISPRAFATVVLDNFAPAPGQRTAVNKGAAAVAGLPPALRARLAPLVAGAQADAEGARIHLEASFDDTMARVSGWYKRKTQIILIVIGIAVVPAVNADSIKMGERMWKDDTIRAAVVAQAQAKAAAKPGAKNLQTAQTTSITWPSSASRWAGAAPRCRTGPSAASRARSPAGS